MAYSLDFRKQCLRLLKEGNSYSKVSHLLKVSRKTLKEWQEREEKGDLAANYPKRRGAYTIDEEKLVMHLNENPDAYLYELAELLDASVQGVSHALKRLGISRKKRRPNTVSVMKQNEKPTKAH